MIRKYSVIVLLGILVLLFLPINKVQTEGFVLEQDKDCIVVRSDDNKEHRFCGISADEGAIIHIDTYASLTSWISFHREKASVNKPLNSSEQLLKRLNAMTIEQKLGQLLVVRTEENLAEPLNFTPGGYILFANDFEGKNKEEIRKMISSLEGALVMVDEEGGKVVRVSSALYEEGYPSAQDLYHQGGWEAVERNMIEKSIILVSLGIHVNLNPVVDVSMNPEDYIYPRAFGQNASMTAEYAALAVRIQNEHGLVSCLKHFPGYGGNKDTHEGFSVDAKALDDYRNHDFLPFLSGIKAGSPMVMMSHVIMEAVDPYLPASLSRSVHDLLREELNFEGIIISDDLMMKAIQYQSRNPLCDALRAGNDLLMTTDPAVSLNELIRAYESGELSMNQIDESVLKVLELKEKLGLLR